MALSDRTQEYLNEAGSALRNAIFHAARNERPATIQAISDLLTSLEKVSTIDNVLDSLDSMKAKWDKKNNE